MSANLTENNEEDPFYPWRLYNQSSVWDGILATIQPSDNQDYHSFEYLATESTLKTEVVRTTKALSPLNLIEIFWIFLFATMLTVSATGNLTVIWIISCHRRMRTVTNYFLLNLAVADLAMAAFNGAPNFVYMLKGDWVFGKYLCIMNNFTANWTVASCVFTMTAISIDRWIAIVKPLEPRMTKTASWLTIVGIWIGSFTIASPALFYTKLVTLKRTSTTHCIVMWPDLVVNNLNPTASKYEFGYNICLLVVTYLIPMIAMAICYGSMSWELWFTQVGEITQRQINSMIAKRKVVRMFIFVVVTFAICWLPYHGYFIYMHIDKAVVNIKWIQHLYLSFFFLAMSQSAINPLIVIGMNSRFRGYVTDSFLNCVHRICCHSENTTPHTVHYVAATPPLLRHYSQSCSKSRSGGGTAEDPEKNLHHNGRPQQNGIRKKNMYVTNGDHDEINLTHSHMTGGGGGHTSTTRGVYASSRATYC